MKTNSKRKRKWGITSSTGNTADCPLSILPKILWLSNLILIAFFFTYSVFILNSRVSFLKKQLEGVGFINCLINSLLAKSFQSVKLEELKLPILESATSSEKQTCKISTSVLTVAYMNLSKTQLFTMHFCKHRGNKLVTIIGILLTIRKDNSKSSQSIPVLLIKSYCLSPL